MKYDQLVHTANHAAEFITVLSETGGPTAVELYEALFVALEDEIEWHQKSVEKLELFKDLIQG